MLSRVKVQGKTVSEAITKGLKELRLRRDQVEVNVLEHPKKGFLGIGAKLAVVEVHKKHWVSDNLDSEIYMDVPRRRGGKGRGRHGRSRMGRRYRRTRDERTPRVHTPKENEPQLLPGEAIQNAVIPENLKAPLQEAKTYMTDVLTHMGIKVENLNSWWDEKQQRILITFDCDKPAIVIGKEGKTLEALQYLCTLAVTRKFDMPVTIVADTQNYWRKAEDKINAEIERAVDMLKHGASVFRFRPMSSQLRRYIHRAVEGNEYVQTASEGEGKWRKVTFRPTQKALDAAKEGIAPDDFVPGVIGEDIADETPAQETATPVAVEETADPAQAPAWAQEEIAQENAPQQPPADEPVPAENETPTEKDETPTQKIATQTVATTVTETVVETNEHVVKEHSVVVSTETEEK